MDNQPIDLAGPTVLALVALGFNIFAGRKGIPTISTGVRRTAASPYGSIVVGAVIGGLIAHWFLDKGDLPLPTPKENPCL